MKNITIKKILVSLLGNCIMGLGVALSTQAQLGTDPSVSFSQAVSNSYNIPIGTMITITNITLAIVVFILYKKNLGLTTLFVVFLNQYPISFFSSLIKHSSSLWINIMLVILGGIFTAIGCDIMINSKLGMGIYDAFIFTFANKYNIDFVKIRYVVDGVFFILTIVFKGYIGIGTVIAYILTGNCMKLFKPYIDKLIMCED